MVLSRCHVNNSFSAFSTHLHEVQTQFVEIVCTNRSVGRLVGCPLANLCEQRVNTKQYPCVYHIGLGECVSSADSHMIAFSKSKTHLGYKYEKEKHVFYEHNKCNVLNIHSISALR